ncbi:hypothetical protein EDC01DRAFT_779829 [Geopyxis carbonaria]|nr:hypothetical protein EDC01DRAFT_779829 [Geopyxis carbonaria]
MSPQLLFRAFSQGRHTVPPPSRRTSVMMYSYLVAGFTLPFVVPALSTGGSNAEGRSLGLHHCCR